MSVKKMKIKELPIMVSDGNYSAKYPKSSEFVESGIPFIRANNIKDNKVIWNDIIYISKEKHSTLLKGHLKKNDVLFTVRGILGHVGIVGEDFENANINAQIALLRADDKYINPKYLMYSLNTNDVKSQIERNQTGTTLKQLPISRLKELVIVMREKSKQDKIVKCLDKSYELIINRKEQIKELDLLVKSKFIEMFGDPVSNPMRWDKKRLADECNIITGNTPSRKVEEYYGNYIEWIKSDNITNSGLYLTTAREYLSEEGLKVGRSIDAGSILMTCIAGSIKCIGNVAMTNRKVAFNQQINGIEPLENNVYFMFQQFKLSQKYMQSTINMSLKGILSKGQLSELEFIFPPIEKQNEFARFFKQIDKLKFEMENSLKKLEDNFNSLMQKSFNGELV
ncbi:restriction endonuclease subunit S [Clostridium perfringens]|nr:restriction endonuclease subunit S [Clostridium perfringens]